MFRQGKYLVLGNKGLFELHAVHEVFAQGFEIPAFGNELNPFSQFRRDGYVDDGSHRNQMNITGVILLNFVRKTKKFLGNFSR